MNEFCGKCKDYRKKMFTTVFECTRYDKCLSGDPPKKCDECIADETKNKKSKKKEYIEVK